MPSDQYIIAVRREARETAPKDWIQQLGAQDGVEVVGESARRVQIRATPEAIQSVHHLVGAYCHIEKLAFRKPLSR